MKFYAVGVYARKIKNRCGLRNEIYFTSYEKARKAFEELCKKYNAYEEPALAYSDCIDERECMSYEDQEGTYVNVSLELSQPCYQLNGNIYKEFKGSRSFK